MEVPSRMDPQAEVLLRALDELASAAGGGDVDVEAQRRVSASAVASISDVDRHRFDGVIGDELITDRAVPVRRYVPSDAVAERAVVFCHGGGWVMGDLDSADRLARTIARSLRVVVVSVDYRLAPEHAFPAALHDCVAVADLVRAEFPAWCAVAGDSAGGQIALGVVLSRQSGTFDAQLLVYPCLDASMGSPSYRAFADGYGLTADAMAYFWQAYGGTHRRDDVLLSPAGVDTVAGWPPTVMVTAGLDVLADEGADLARRLVAAGVPVDHLTYATLPHGFTDMVDRVEAARLAVGEVMSAFSSLLPTASG